VRADRRTERRPTAGRPSDSPRKAQFELALIPMNIHMKVYHRCAGDSIAYYDFGESQLSYMPHYKWDGCKNPRQCVFVENDDGPVPRLYDLRRKKIYKYDASNVTWSSMQKRALMYGTCVRTNRGIMLSSDICKRIGFVSDINVTTDYYTDEVSQIDRLNNDIIDVGTDRGEKVEHTQIQFKFLPLRSHNVIGQSIYIIDDSIVHCDRRIGHAPTRITSSVWSVYDHFKDGNVPFASRVMGEHIIAISYIIQRLKVVNPRHTAIDGTHIYANL
jgi:hypothetical protein